MNIESTLTEQPSGEQPHSNEPTAVPNSSNQKTASKDNHNRNKIAATLKRRKRACLPIKQSTKGTLAFALFLSITLIVGVSTVYFTSPKSGTTCHLAFKRTLQSSISLSSQPRSIAVGDFNNDERIDMVAANSGSNTIEIFISHIDGMFSNQTTYSTGSQSKPYSVIADDFNNDNYLDIAVANYGANNIGIFFGNGNGTFRSQKVFQIGSSRPLFIASGDLNNDNRTDIVVANYGTSNIGILFGSDNGSFRFPVVYSTGYDSFPYSLAVGDFNKDSVLDIAIVNNGTNNIGIVLGNGNGTLTSQKIYSTGRYSSPSSVALGDFNNDTQLDIAVANYGASNISIFFGYGNGTFAAQKTYPIGLNARPSYISVGDFNKDNHQDVVIADSENNQVHILPGYGNGSFAIITTYDTISGSRPLFVAVANFDNDNRSDIAVANYGTNNIRVLSRYYSEPSVKSTNYFVGRDSRPTSVAINDFNNDNHMDIVVNNFNNDSVLMLTGYGNGNFDIGKAYSTGSQSAPQHISVGDLNNDNRTDIVTANYGSDNVGVLLGQDNGTFATVTTYSTGTGSGPHCVVLGDVNKDHRLDIVSVNSNDGSVIILLGYGNGTFANATIYPTDIISDAFTIALGDVNNDNRLDSVIGYVRNGNVSVLLGHGNGTFEKVMSFSGENVTSTASIVLADLNNDSQLDIVLIDSVTSSVGVLLGYGNGTFGMTTLYSTGTNSIPYRVIVIHFNDDNYYDIAVTNLGNDQVVIFFGHGNGSFELARTFSTGSGSSPYGIAFGNLNNNNQSQLVVTYWGNGNVGVLTEYDAALFDIQITYSTGSAPNPYSIAIDDFNNDHQFDIVVANSGTDNIGILLNLGNSTFGTQMMYSIGMDSNPQYVLAGDINKDNHSDIVTANSKNDSISLIMGYGNGTFAAQTMYSTGKGSYPSALALGDVNNDNLSDIIIANKDTDSIALLIGFDYASFQSHNTYSNMGNVRLNQMIVSDFNHDNNLDIATVFMGSNSVGILLGYSNGSFAVQVKYSTGYQSFPYWGSLGDFNGDGRLDITTANYNSNSVGIFLGNGNGSFAAVVTYSTGDSSGPVQTSVGDFNNDSRLDIAVANIISNTFVILFGFGDGSFLSGTLISTGIASQPQTLATGDFNKDGRLDIAAGYTGLSYIQIFLRYGSEPFASVTTYAIDDGSQPHSVAIGDFNNDGHSDIVVANYGTNTVGVLLGYGNGVSDTMITYPTGVGSAPYSVAASDFNSDNRLDIVVTNSETNNVAILLGFGNGTFAIVATYSTGDRSRPYTVTISDFNNDNISDIAVANSGTSNILFLYGYGNGTFGNQASYALGYGYLPYGIAVKDLNHDGWMDIVIACYGTDHVETLIKMC